MARVTQRDLVVSSGLLERNPGLAAELAKTGAPASGAAAEADLQANCERWLRDRGYVPRTPRFLLYAGRMATFRGWYLHMHRAPQNPILLDLLILDRWGQYLEIELKTQKGRVSAEQQALVQAGGRLARNLAGFREIVLEWEGEEASRRGADSAQDANRGGEHGDSAESYGRAEKPQDGSEAPEENGGTSRRAAE